MILISQKKTLSTIGKHLKRVREQREKVEQSIFDDNKQT